MESQLEKCPSCQLDLSKILEAMENETLTFCPKCQFPLLQIAGKYRLERVLRRGGCSVVYLAKHIHLDRDPERVIKIIRPEFFTIKGMETRFRREVQITAALSQCNDNIVRIFDDFGQIPNIGHFYVMEYLQGSPLSGMLQDPALLPSLSFCFHLFIQLCEAVQLAHDADVVHRDLKPDNLMLVKRKRDPYFLKILDFGIAKPMSNEALPSTQVTQGSLGTPSYMAPEQCLNQPTDARTDIYAMGIILYELLTGRTPFLPPKGEHSAYDSVVGVIEGQITKAPPSPHDLRPDRVTLGLEKLILKALAKRPDERFQTVDNFREMFIQEVSSMPAFAKEGGAFSIKKGDAPQAFPLGVATPSSERKMTDGLSTSELETAFSNASVDGLRQIPMNPVAPLKDASPTLLYGRSSGLVENETSKSQASPSRSGMILLTTPKSSSQQVDLDDESGTLMYARSQSSVVGQKDISPEPIAKKESLISPASEDTASYGVLFDEGEKEEASIKIDLEASFAEEAQERETTKAQSPALIMKVVDRIQGPRDGLIRLFLHEKADWDAEPMRLKHLQENVIALKAFVTSDAFVSLYPGCRAKIILEAPSFPREVVESMMREDIELRVLSQPAPLGSSKKMAVMPKIPKKKTMGQSSQNPRFLEASRGSKEKNTEQTAQKKKEDKANKSTNTPSSTRPSGLPTARLLGQGRLQPIVAAPVSQPPLPILPHSVKQAHPSPKISPLPQVPTPMVIWEEADDYEPVLLAPKRYSSPAVVISGLILLCALLGLVYAGLLMETKPDPGTYLKTIQPEDVSSFQQPKASYRQISLHPDRSTFTLVPVQDRLTGKTEMFVLFSTLENRKLLVYAPQAQSQVLRRMKKRAGSSLSLGELGMDPVWSRDLVGQGRKPRSRTYTGSLERLQRRENGPLELVLPDENRNINKIPGFVQAGIHFPIDSMVLLVGQKPKRPEDQRASMIWTFLLIALLAGGSFFSFLRQSQRAF